MVCILDMLFSNDNVRGSTCMHDNNNNNNNNNYHDDDNNNANERID